MTMACVSDIIRLPTSCSNALVFRQTSWIDADFTLEFYVVSDVMKQLPYYIISSRLEPFRGGVFPSSQLARGGEKPKISGDLLLPPVEWQP